MPATNSSKKNPYGLNDMECKFCQEYVIDRNGTRSARKAGYSKKTAGVQATGILKRPNIQQYLTILLREQATRTATTADDVLKTHVQIRDIALGTVPKRVTVDQDDDGNDVMIEEYDYDLANARQANKDIGEHFKVFSDSAAQRDVYFKVVIVDADGKIIDEDE